MVTILENILFDSGKADVKLESLGIAKEMSSLLVSASPREITVSGHTDNVPIANRSCVELGIKYAAGS